MRLFDDAFAVARVVPGTDKQYASSLDQNVGHSELREEGQFHFPSATAAKIKPILSSKEYENFSSHQLQHHLYSSALF